MNRIWKDMVQSRTTIEREYVENIINFISILSEGDHKHMLLLHVLGRYHMSNYTDDWAGFAMWFIDTLSAADEAEVTLEFLDATNAIRREVFK